MSLASRTAPHKSNGARLRRTVQTLGGNTYAIPEASVEKPSLLKRLIPVLALLFFPLLMTIIILYTGIMIFAPIAWRHALIARFIPPAMERIKRITQNQRKLLLQHVSGRVLDVGSGAGAYMSFIGKKATHVVALEPITEMHPSIRKEAKRVGFGDHQITISAEHIEDYAAANPTQAASFDWIIMGNVLCEVCHQQSTLDTVHTLLKKGGHIYFSEHVGSPPNTVLRTVQELINPWWCRVSGGCNCNRDSLHSIEKMAGWDTVSWEMNKMAPPCGGTFVMGLSQKVVG